MDVVTDDPVLDEATLHEAIVHCAHELWESRGRVEGHADEDWAQAEAEVRKRFSQPRVASPAFLSVKGQRFVYTCRYDRNCTDYRPGDIAPDRSFSSAWPRGSFISKCATIGNWRHSSPARLKSLPERNHDCQSELKMKSHP